jgi:hypothetical protein
MPLARETRDKLLGLIGDGFDLESGAAQLGVSPQTIRKDDRLMAEVGEAFKVGTAKLRARVFQSALDNNDLKILGQMLERRETEQKQLAVTTPGALNFDKFSDDQFSWR